MMSRKAVITRHLQEYDRELYCGEGMEGKLCVFRKSHRWESYDLDDGSVLTSLRPSPHYIFALTDNWRPNGTSVDWGIEPILAKVRAADVWKRDVVGDIIRQEEEHEQKVDREFDSKAEDFFREIAPTFKKELNDYNVATVAKKDLRKLKEKSKWQL